MDLKPTDTGKSVYLSAELITHHQYGGRVSLSHSTLTSAPSSMPATPNPIQEMFMIPPRCPTVASLSESSKIIGVQQQRRSSLSSTMNLSQHTKQYSLSQAGTRSESHLLSPEPPSPQQMEDPLGTLTDDPFSAAHVQPRRQRASTLNETDEGVRMTRLSAWGMLTFPPTPTPDEVSQQDRESRSEKEIEEHAVLSQTLLKRLEKGATQASKGITGSWGRKTRK